MGQSQIAPYLMGLSSKGYNITIVSFEKPGTYSKEKNQISELISSSGLKWIPLRYHKFPPVLSTLFDLWRLWITVNKLHRLETINIIHCRSYITSLIGLRAKQKWGTKFIFDMRGFWADERVEGGLWNLKNPIFFSIYKFFKKKELKFLTNSDYVISLTETAKKEIESWSINLAPMAVIPTCVDLNLFNPESINREEKRVLRSRLGIRETDFVLLYLGSWGTWYLMNKMFEFFRQLRLIKTDVKFLIITNDKVALENFDFKEDVIVTNSPRIMVPGYIAIADASIFFIKTSFSKKASSATKMGECMAMQRPIITNKGWGDVDIILAQNKSSLVLESLSQSDLKKNASVLLQMKAGQALYDVSNFSLQKGIESYSQIYRILNNSLT